MDNLKISVIGVGHLGAIHCGLLAKNKSVNFIGVYDTDANKKIKQANLHNVNAFDTVDVAIDSADAVIVVVPTIFHKEVAEKILTSGKHCFIEKPVCSNLYEAKKLLELEKRYAVKIQIGHIERFNPAIISAQKHTLNPSFIEAHRLSQFRPRSVDVSVIHDLMIHDIDLSLWLANGSRVESIDANGVSIITDTIDLASARIKFENGMVANLTASRISAKPMRKFRIFQKHSYFSLDLASGKVEAFRIIDNITDNSTTEISVPTEMLGEIPALKDKKIVYEMLEIPSINAMAIEQQSFIDSIIHNKLVACSLLEGVNALEIAERINELVMNENVRRR